MPLHLISILLLFALAGCEEKPQRYNGYVEGGYTYISTTTSGILKTLNVKRGDSIKKGDLLFAIEDTELKTTLEKSKLAILETQSILTENSLKAEFEVKEANFLVSQAKYKSAQQNLLTAEKKLEESSPLAQEKAIVENTFFSPGEFVPLGRPVLSTLIDGDVKIRFFIPEHQLPKIQLQQKVLNYISKTAEYTPPVIYSKDARAKMVFLLEARPEKAEPCLHPGLPVDIEIKT
jgi:HlyD family secretion protein